MDLQPTTALPMPAPWLSRADLPRSSAVAERALWAVARRSGVAELRATLVGVLVAPIRRALPACEVGSVRIGIGRGPRARVGAGGLRLYVPLTSQVDPHDVCLVHRCSDGTIQVRAGVCFLPTGAEGRERWAAEAIVAVHRAVSGVERSLGCPVDWLSPTLLWLRGAG